MRLASPLVGLGFLPRAGSRRRSRPVSATNRPVQQAPFPSVRLQSNFQTPSASVRCTTAGGSKVGRKRSRYTSRWSAAGGYRAVPASPRGAPRTSAPEKRAVRLFVKGVRREELHQYLPSNKQSQTAQSPPRHGDETAAAVALGREPFKMPGGRPPMLTTVWTEAAERGHSSVQISACPCRMTRPQLAGIRSSDREVKSACSPMLPTS